MKFIANEGIKTEALVMTLHILATFVGIAIPQK